MALFLSSGDGTGARFLWPNDPYIQEVAIGLTWTTTVVLMVEFAQHFLRMKHRRRVTHTARWVQIVAGIVGLLVVVSPTPTIYGLQTGYSVLIFMFTLSLAVQRALRADRSGNIFLAATLPLAIGTSVHILLLFGLINSDYLLHYSIHISAVFELALFSTALVYRLRQNEQARWQAHRRSVELDRLNKELSSAKSMGVGCWDQLGCYSLCPSP